MPESIIQNLIDNLAAAIICETTDFLKATDEAENIETGCNRNSAADPENLYHHCESHVEDVVMEKIMAAVKAKLGVYQS